MTYKIEDTMPIVWTINGRTFLTLKDLQSMVPTPSNTVEISLQGGFLGQSIQAMSVGLNTCTRMSYYNKLIPIRRHNEL